MEYINKYYENGDVLIKVIAVIDSDKGLLLICISYSYNHDAFSIDTLTYESFRKWYESNEKTDGEYLMPLFKTDNTILY